MGAQFEEYAKHFCVFWLVEWAGLSTTLMHWHLCLSELDFDLLYKRRERLRRKQTIYPACEPLLMHNPSKISMYWFRGWKWCKEYLGCFRPYVWCCSRFWVFRTPEGRFFYAHCSQRLDLEKAIWPVVYTDSCLPKWSIWLKNLGRGSEISSTVV